MDLSFIDGLIAFVAGMSKQYPVIVGVFAILYSIGLGFKLIFSAFKEYVIASPSKSDDALVAKAEANKIFKVVKFIMDLLIRLKI